MPARITITVLRAANQRSDLELILLACWLLVAELISSVSHYSFGESFWLAWASFGA